MFFIYCVPKSLHVIILSVVFQKTYMYFFYLLLCSKGEIPWCMLFADDVVLVDESRAGVNRKLEL